MLFRYSSSRRNREPYHCGRGSICGWIIDGIHAVIHGCDDHSGDLSLYAEREYDINAGSSRGDASILCDG